MSPIACNSILKNPEEIFEVFLKTTIMMVFFEFIKMKINGILVHCFILYLFLSFHDFYLNIDILKFVHF